MKKNNSYYQNLRPEIYEIVPRSANKILEIGCAVGGFRLNFDEQVEYWGVEPVHEAAEQARQKHIRVLCGTYDDVCTHIPDGHFDVIACNDYTSRLLKHEWKYNRTMKMVDNRSALELAYSIIVSQPIKELPFGFHRAEIFVDFLRLGWISESEGLLK